jgi:hypothetical protein
MDYQPMGQEPSPVMNQAPAPMPSQGSANGIWYAVGAAVVIALGLWYFYGTSAPATTTVESTAVEQTALPALTGGNTTADISADLNQIPDTGAALDADASAAASALSGL